MPSTSSTSRRAAGRVLVLLVLAVLSGVLGMHALPPGGALPAAHAEAGHAAMTSPPAPPHEASAACSHLSDGAGHLNHADAACAAAGVGSTYAPPTLGAALTDAAAVPAALDGAAASAQHDRAPPDLSELQLLRI
ncbi:hypothetical protein StrepF001_45025 [Streptomyces sp. F001]|uniref:DUF6153 family protein n=1 Tax=Streptomyces sp. F001 TaxID=1510026 RepID=UPI00101E7BB3|nr:DUF6153 family protein [Streptomyces sp. F001]RZB13282.1 hypothetical protein StrepF001_45025 [Streptomyces sp. F001]